MPVIAPADRNANGFAYVQNHTYFWVAQAPGQWAPVTATAAVPGLSVTVTAVPERLTVDPGDGGHLDCPGAPPALAPNSSPAGFDGCGYIYRDSSAMAPNGRTYPVTVTDRLARHVAGQLREPAATSVACPRHRRPATSRSPRSRRW